MNKKYSNFLTILLVVIIIAILVIIGVLGYKYYKTYVTKNSSQDFVRILWICSTDGQKIIRTMIVQMIFNMMEL